MSTFQSWSSYWGLLYEDHDDRFHSRVYGFENIHAGQVGSAEIPPHGACYGMIASGSVLLMGDRGRPGVTLTTGQWFSTPSGCALVFETTPTAVLVAQRVGHFGVYTSGGPIESRGRLRYIDGCSDSLLCCPSIVGDPCLNHLHFPGGIDQTQHTHPSLRAGIIVRGQGWCVTPGQEIPLTPNLIFVIPTDALHSFRTETDESMDVVPYHPDSNWGPTHEEHPMVNKTLVGGRKIDNSQGRHATAELIEGFRP